MYVNGNKRQHRRKLSMDISEKSRIPNGPEITINKNVSQNPKKRIITIIIMMIRSCPPQFPLHKASDSVANPAEYTGRQLEQPEPPTMTQFLRAIHITYHVHTTIWFIW